MNRIKIAKQLLVLAKSLVSMEFDTEEEKKKYQQEHEVRPGTKLTVKKGKPSGQAPKAPKAPATSQKPSSIGTGKALFNPIDVGKKWSVEAERMEDGSIQGYATNADSARTYVMGDDDFKDVPANVGQILKRAIKKTKKPSGQDEEKFATFNRFEISMTKAQAESVSHSGDAEADVVALLKDPKIQEQLAKINPDKIREELKEYGAWEDDELQDDEANKRRILWIGGGDISEEKDEDK